VFGPAQQVSVGESNSDLLITLQLFFWDKQSIIYMTHSVRDIDTRRGPDAASSHQWLSPHRGFFICAQQPNL
jgi:hypothetical protein